MQVTPFEGLARLHLVMGLQCNVRCSMCYQPDFSAKFNMPPELYEERLAEAYAHVSTVRLQGGEPTIMKNCRATALLLRAHSHVSLDIATNGVLIDDFWHETLVARGGRVSVSLHAATTETYDRIVADGDHARVVKNLERLLAARSGKTPTVGITAVVVKENVLELHRLIELSAKLGVDFVELLVDPVRSVAGLPPLAAVAAELGRCLEASVHANVDVVGLDELAKLLPLPIQLRAAPRKTSRCRAPFEDVVVDWDGDVRVCSNSWVKLGNLYKTPLANILRGRRARAFRTRMEHGNYLWCAPDCPDNAAPSRLALAHKVAYELRADPRKLVAEVREKLEHEVQSHWGKTALGSRAPFVRKVRLPVFTGDSPVSAFTTPRADRRG